MKIHSEKGDTALHVAVLLALCALLYLPHLGGVFFNRGEPREALVVQDIFLNGDWLFPLKGGEDIPSKPPLFHWLGALISLASGEVSETTVRLPSALLATAGVLALYVLGRSLFPSGAAFWGAAILAVLPLYETQAVSARVDMTLAACITLTLVLFYLIYKGRLQGHSWSTLFYVLLGVSVLAKGPVGMLLPLLAIGVFLGLRRRWDFFAELFFSPKMAIALMIGVFWYALAILEGGEAFFSKQIWHENLARFFVHGEGGTGHQKPVYYYIPYLFLQGLPWSLFLPLVAIDWIKERFWKEEERLFLACWFLVIFVFYSLAAGKRAVYLLPLYPALALALGEWFQTRRKLGKTSVWGLRLIGALFIFSVALPLGTALAAMVSGKAFLGLSLFVGSRLNPEHVESFSRVQFLFRDAGVVLVLGTAFLAVLAVLLSRDLFRLRLRWVPAPLALLCLIGWTVGQWVFVAELAKERSYASFMQAVNRTVGPEALYLYGGEFDPSPIYFYRGAPVSFLPRDPAFLTQKLSEGGYVIMAEGEWIKARAFDERIPHPRLKSDGRGWEGKVPLVLIHANQTG